MCGKRFDKNDGIVHEHANSHASHAHRLPGPASVNEAATLVDLACAEVTSGIRLAKWILSRRLTANRNQVRQRSQIEPAPRYRWRTV